MYHFPASSFKPVITHLKTWKMLAIHIHLMTKPPKHHLSYLVIMHVIMARYQTHSFSISPFSFLLFFIKYASIIILKRIINCNIYCIALCNAIFPEILISTHPNKKDPSTIPLFRYYGWIFYKTYLII